MFLSIVTRTTPGRDDTLFRLIDSITEQEFENCEHILFGGGADLYDANISLYDHREDVNGDFVLVVDDDDLMTAGSLPELERAIGASNAPLYRVGVHCAFPVPDGLPCSISSFVARRDVWLECAGAFRVPNGAPVHFLRCAEARYEPEYVDSYFVIRDQVGQQDGGQNEAQRLAWQEGVAFVAGIPDDMPLGSVFCYGANNLPWLSFAAETVTVAEWSEQVDGTMGHYWKSLGPATLDYEFVPIAYDDDPLAEFATYIDSTDDLFDAVFIEARCPPLCVELAAKHLGDGGRIVLNSHKARRYQKALDGLRLLAEFDDGVLTTGVFGLR